MSKLKKEFKEKDVQRLRNLVQGKFGEKTRSSVGFSKADEFHIEGDIWESEGRTWTIKEGIKQNITKLDKAKKAYSMPLFCPNCGKVMKHRNDKTFYNIHKKCFNCVIDMEHQLKKEGKLEEYQIKIKNNEIDNHIILNIKQKKSLVKGFLCYYILLFFYYINLMICTVKISKKFIVYIVAVFTIEKH